MVEKHDEVSLPDVCPSSLSERIKIQKFSRLKEWEITAMDSASVKSMICVGKFKKKKKKSQSLRQNVFRKIFF